MDILNYAAAKALLDKNTVPSNIIQYIIIYKSGNSYTYNSKYLPKNDNGLVIVCYSDNEGHIYFPESSTVTGTNQTTGLLVKNWAFNVRDYENDTVTHMIFAFGSTSDNPPVVSLVSSKTYSMTEATGGANDE